jgi:protein TonB
MSRQVPPANSPEWIRSPEPPRSDRALFTAAGCILVVILAIVAWALWHRAPTGQSAAAVQTMALPPPTAVPGPVAAERPEEAFVGPIRPTPRTVASASRPVKQLESPTLTAPPAPPVSAVVVDEHDAPASAEAAHSEVAVAPDAADATVAPLVPSTVSGPTYDTDDTDVTPPTAIFPQLFGMLSQSSPGVRNDVMTISVVVNERGSVDSVKAVNVPLSIGESVMLTAALSAVKSWHFRPAMKDGAAVKYRQIVPLKISGDFIP